MKRAIILIVLIFMTIIFHNEVISGTTQGLLIWYRTLIPALLPFIIITNALFETHSYNYFAYYFQKQSDKIYKYIAIILGNLCGYPIGAKILNDFVLSGNISSDDANDLLSFSSQSNPMFFLGFVYPLLEEGTLSIPSFLLLIYIPNILLYYIYNKCINNIRDHSNPKSNNHCPEQDPIDISGTFLQAVDIMVVIGVYVIIFSIIIKILLPLAHNNLSKCILSFLEITNGLKLIDTLCIPIHLRECLLMALSSFGGLCTSFQIKCVLSYQGASIKKYLRDKLIISTGTFILTLLYLTFN